jgi:hypothetical protein
MVSAAWCGFHDSAESSRSLNNEQTQKRRVAPALRRAIVIARNALKSFGAVKRAAQHGIALERS